MRTTVEIIATRKQTVTADLSTDQRKKTDLDLDTVRNMSSPVGIALAIVRFYSFLNIMCNGASQLCSH
jgi:hypothetical protein